MSTHSYIKALSKRLLRLLSGQAVAAAEIDVSFEVDESLVTVELRPIIVFFLVYLQRVITNILCAANTESYSQHLNRWKSREATP